MQVNSHRDHLLWYVIFLRVTPIIPNWVINIISPVVDMPLWIFFVATFIGTVFTVHLPYLIFAFH